MVIPIIVLMMLTPLAPLYSFDISNSTFPVAVDLYSILCLVIFILASVTDWLDGYLSRKYNWVSDFGKILDPIADKVLINSIMILFAVQQKTSVIFTILFISRDTIVDAIRMMAAKKQMVIAANIWGKLKTVFQMFAIIFIYLFGVNVDMIAGWWYWGIQNLILYIALFFSLLSGLIYIRNYIKINKTSNLNIDRK